MMRLAFLAILATVLATAALPLSAQTPQPYAGLETRPIKALSDEQIADLRAGRGMGMALAAELNGYPGPRHVIDLAEPLGLSEMQRRRTEEMFAAMQSETIALGEQLIAEEAALDSQFAEKTITPESLDAALRAIGSTQGALRAAHLKYHLATIDILEPMQVAHYAELRGYASGAPLEGHTGHHQ
jgi:hypothetical protein